MLHHDTLSPASSRRLTDYIHTLVLALLMLAGTGTSAQPLEGTSELVWVGTIDGEINLAQSAFVKRLVERATLDDARALVLELNTFGGRLDAAVAIRDMLLDSEVETIVFINKRAISAGALISLACDRIVMSPGGTIGAATPVLSGPGQEMPQPVAEKYLSYFRTEMRVTAETNGRDGDIAAAMVDADIEVPDLIESGKLLTMTTGEAVEYGMADAEATSLEGVLEGFEIDGRPSTLERSWAEGLAAFLTSQAVASLLFLGMVVLGYLEMQSPGFGAMGAGALICFLLLYFGHHLVNLAGWEEVLLLAVGAGLLIAELVLIPGFGILGVLGLLAVLASAVLLLMAGDWSDLHFSNPFSVDAFLRVLVTTAVAMGTIGVLMRYAPALQNTRLGSRLMLTRGLETESGYVSHDPAEAGLLGRRGVALTALRPTGKAVFDGKRVNVESEGGYIDADEEVEVVREIEGRHVVRRAKA